MELVYWVYAVFKTSSSSSQAPWTSPPIRASVEGVSYPLSLPTSLEAEASFLSQAAGLLSPYSLLPAKDYLPSLLQAAGVYTQLHRAFGLELRRSKCQPVALPPRQEVASPIVYSFLLS